MFVNPASNRPAALVRDVFWSDQRRGTNAWRGLQEAPNRSGQSASSALLDARSASSSLAAAAPAAAAAADAAPPPRSVTARAVRVHAILSHRLTANNDSYYQRSRATCRRDSPRLPPSRCVRESSVHVCTSASLVVMMQHIQSPGSTALMSALLGRIIARTVTD